MEVNELTKIIEEKAFDMNADIIDFVNSECFYDCNYTGNKPQDIMPEVKSIIIIGVGISKGAFEILPAGRAEYTNTLMAGTATLRIIAFQLVKIIEKQGYKATIIPSEGSEFGYWYANRETLKANMSIKFAAYHAGLGNFGLNHLLINSKYGPRLRMTAILTNVQLNYVKKIKLPFVNIECTHCFKCVHICPVNAISKTGNIDRYKCADYMFNVLKGLRCGMCIKVCPL